MYKRDAAFTATMNLNKMDKNDDGRSLGFDSVHSNAHANILVPYICMCVCTLDRPLTNRFAFDDFCSVH